MIVTRVPRAHPQRQESSQHSRDPDAPKNHRPGPAIAGWTSGRRALRALQLRGYFAVCESTISVTTSFWFAALKRASVEFPATAEVTEARYVA